MIRKYKYLLTVMCFCMPFLAFNQLLDSTELTATQDTYVDSRYPTTSYGTIDTMKSGTNVVSGKFGSNIYYQRIFVEYDLSSIPSNAIIYSADILLTRANGITANFDWKTKLVRDSWNENITLNTQPTISNTAGDVSTVAATTDAVQTIDVTDMVQRMVYGIIPNNGWSIQVDDENYSGYSGTWFYTEDYSSQDDRPKLKVKYYLPLSISNVNIQHESASGQEDAIISYSLSNGCSSSYSYRWVNSNDSLISTNDSLINVSDGWYGLQVSGSDCSDTLYLGFLVGTECEEVTITYSDLANFVENNRVLSNNPDNSYPDGTVLRAESWTNGAWYYSSSFLRYYTWMDDKFVINQADLEMDNFPAGWAQHYSSTSPTNAAKMNIITEDWNKDFVTYNYNPTSSTSTHAVLSTTGSGYSTASKTIDMTDLWEEWKSDNNSNYGCEFMLDTYANVYNKQMYASNLYAGTTYDPVWTFKLELSHPNNPLLCGGAEERPYNELRKELDGGYGESYNDTLNFALDENYGIDTLQYIEAKIYNDDNVLVASCDASGNTFGGMPALTYVFDDNRYVMDLSGITMTDQKFYTLEVKNAKEDRFYLKFKHNE
ncbi:MAG: DNRLRE domain-containing protein [Fluviicola sp.]